MPKVTVRGYASFVELLGPSDFEVDSDAETVGSLIGFLAERFNPRLRELLLDSATRGVLKGNKILVNGRDVDFLQGLETRIKDGDRIVLFPPTGGG
jgi:molybdopterin synthase sulfur carrier subunit